MTLSDCAPNAHACRLRISLVTIDSPVQCPWDLTKELFGYIIKLAHVSATCRLLPSEEYQLLLLAITDISDIRFDPKIFSIYEIFIVKNRLSRVKALISDEVTALMFSLPRDQCEFSTTGWPYYCDPSALCAQQQDWSDYTVFYAPSPMISGEVVMKTISCFWEGAEDMSGHALELGFLFIYGLLTVAHHSEGGSQSIEIVYREQSPLRSVIMMILTHWRVFFSRQCLIDTTLPLCRQFCIL